MDTNCLVYGIEIPNSDWDRTPASVKVSLEQRQLSWAHLKREFIKISERRGVSGDIGKNLVKQDEF